MATVPKMKTDEEIAEFWDTHSLADYDEDLEVVENLEFVKPEKQIVSVRLDRKDIKTLKTIARKKGLGHSTLARILIKEKLNELIPVK